MPKPRRKAMDMTTGSPLKMIILFGIPILIGSLFQQLYNMVDSIVVGNYVGANALAAVGASSNVSLFLVAASSGLTTGASVVVAQLVGAQQTERIKRSISTTLIFLLVLSVVLSVAGALLSDVFCRWLNVPDNIFEDSVTYLRIYMLGVVFMVLYNFFAAILRSLGDSTTPLIFLIISSLLNIAGDLWFVLGLGWGVAGVAWATVLAQAVSVLLCSIYVNRCIAYFHFGRGEFCFDRPLFREILRIGVPSALQGSVMSLGFLLVQSLVNSFGSAHIAAYTVAGKMEQMAHLPVDSFAMGYSVFAGQNMGAGNIERTKDGMKKTFFFTAGICIVLAVILCSVGDKLVELFVDDSETEVIEYGFAFLRAFAPFTVIFAAMNALNGTLRGAGDSFFSMISMMCDLGGRVIAAYIYCSFESIGFLGIAYSIPTGWVLATIVAFLRYRSGKWQSKTVQLHS